MPDVSDMIDRLFYMVGTQVLRLKNNKAIATGAWDAVPTATEFLRGAFIRTEGATSAADSLVVVLKNASDVYENRPLALEGLAAGETVFNEAGDDVDFRIESDTAPFAFSIDGATGAVNVGTTQAGIVASFSSTGGSVFNENGANRDFRVEGDTDVNALVVDASADQVGIGTATPNTKLTVNGGIAIVDGMTAPSATVGFAKIFVDTADGDLKVIFGDGTTKTIVADT